MLSFGYALSGLEKKSKQIAKEKTCPHKWWCRKCVLSKWCEVKKKKSRLNQKKKKEKATSWTNSPVTLQKYEKPRLQDDAHMELFIKSKKVFNSRQLAALKKIYHWRDKTARAEDESIGWVPLSMPRNGPANEKLLEPLGWTGCRPHLSATSWHLLTPDACRNRHTRTALSDIGFTLEKLEFGGGLEKFKKLAITKRLELAGCRFVLFRYVLPNHMLLQIAEILPK